MNWEIIERALKIEREKIYERMKEEGWKEFLNLVRFDMDAQIIKDIYSVVELESRAKVEYPLDLDGQ